MKKKNNSSKGLIKAITIIDYIFAALFLVGAIIMLLGSAVLTTLGLTVFVKSMLPKSMMSALIGSIFILGTIFFVALGIFYVYLGKGIQEKKQWAKIVQIIAALIIHLLSFPIGTAIAIFELYVLLINKETRDLFTK